MMTSSAPTTPPRTTGFPVGGSEGIGLTPNSLVGVGVLAIDDVGVGVEVTPGVVGVGVTDDPGDVGVGVLDVPLDGAGVGVGVEVFPCVVGVGDWYGRTKRVVATPASPSPPP